MHLFWCSSKANQLFLAFFEKCIGCVTLVVVEGDFIPHALPPVSVFFFQRQDCNSNSTACPIIIVVIHVTAYIYSDGPTNAASRIVEIHMASL